MSLTTLVLGLNTIIAAWQQAQCFKYVEQTPRLKGFNLENFLDSKIAEEQARQRNAQQSPSSSAGQRRTPSNARPSNARTDSRSRRPQGGDGDKAPTVKGPDPSEFVIEDDDSLPSRAATPKPPAKDGSDETTVDRAQAANENAPADKDAGSGEKAAEAKAPEELPQDVRLKLRKLEKLESRYHDLLRSYRIAHSRVTAIEPFEAALRENTPLASIADPSALVEYLSQINLKGDMVMQELKRVSGERDELRVKLEEAEKQTKVAYDEAAGLRKERDDAAAEKIKNSDGGATGSDTAQEDADPLGVQKANKEAAADQTQEGKATSKAEEKEKSEDLFSYESEVPRLQAEVQKQSEYINELTTENATLRSDLGTARDSYQKVLDTQEETSRNHQVAKELLEREKVQLENKIETAEREARGIREQLANSTNTSQAEQENMQAQVKILEGELAGAQTKLQDTEKSMRDLSDKAQAAEAAAQSREHELKKQLETLRAEVSDNASDKKRIGTLDNLVKSMKTQLQDAEAATRIAEADLASLRETLSHAEQGRDIAQEALNSKKGHESAVVSLRSQLKKTEKERDDAYQMILNCGKCEIPKQDEQSAPVAGAQDAPGLAASAEENKEDADGAGQGAKKKKKNKNKRRRPQVEHKTLLKQHLRKLHLRNPRTKHREPLSRWVKARSLFCRTSSGNTFTVIS
ncbi:Golgin imh1 [Taxawa tesnikishii (nom. ined.)]|nr:Golgin imh1 [Dothideales sp. JES 119]